MQKLCTATCTILARLLPGLVHNSCTDTDSVQLPYKNRARKTAVCARNGGL